MSFTCALQSAETYTVSLALNQQQHHRVSAKLLSSRRSSIACMFVADSLVLQKQHKLLCGAVLGIHEDIIKGFCATLPQRKDHQSWLYASDELG